MSVRWLPAGFLFIRTLKTVFYMAPKGICTDARRPDLNMQRMYRSSRRLMLADYDPGAFQWLFNTRNTNPLSPDIH